MIAVDTNILVYSHREDSIFYETAINAIKKLAESGKEWAIPWPCIYEFLAIVTHPNIYVPPTPLEDAILQVEMWLKCPTMSLIGETENADWQDLKRVLETSRVVGPQMHDARIASICLIHGVEELWTADRDFSRFPALTVRNPLIKS